VIRQADLGLFHGAETFAAYAPYSRNPQIVHDIAVPAQDRIAPAALAAKVSAVNQGPLRIVYAGRADPMKGPRDWLAAMQTLARTGVDFHATWLGDGRVLAEMRALVAAQDLGGRVALPGFVTDRAALLAALRQAHVFAFCHLTPESPRCLIEALMSGTPILGYEGAFARDLIAGKGGGQLVPRGDHAALAAALAGLSRDRTRLADLVARAAADGQGFDDVSVFAHRSHLIRTHLGPLSPAPIRP
jgi:glycosyltransferase involved in cell wall biosynthesis